MHSCVFSREHMHFHASTCMRACLCVCVCGGAACVYLCTWLECALGGTGVHECVVCVGVAGGGGGGGGGGEGKEGKEASCS